MSTKHHIPRVIGSRGKSSTDIERENFEKNQVRDQGAIIPSWNIFYVLIYVDHTDCTNPSSSYECTFSPFND